jgi:hypothetical protein
MDDMLNVAQAIYGPSGEEDCRWVGLKEFEEIAERFGQGDLCFGFGDEGGLTLETPIGETSALIRLRTDVPHPAMGNGLLASLQFPFVRNEADVVNDCLWLNFFESIQWTNVPQFGSWHPREVGDGQFSVAHSFFIPNALFAPGLATNVALWQFGRARWAKNTFWGHLEDLTMMEVMNKRFGGRPSE